MGPHPAHCPERTETGSCHHDLPQGHRSPQLSVGGVHVHSGFLPTATSPWGFLCYSCALLQSQVSHRASQQDHRQGTANGAGAGDPLGQCVTNSTLLLRAPSLCSPPGNFLSLCRSFWSSDPIRFPRYQWGSQLPVPGRQEHQLWVCPESVDTGKESFVAPLL